MHYVWQYRLLTPDDMVTVDGRRVCVIDPGRLNTGAGPDFFNAKIRIGDRLWAGDVEMHVRASDWHRHGHDGDRAYDSVVLHVVDADDTPICRSNGEVIAQMRMRCSPRFHEDYALLTGRADISLPCAGEMAAMEPLHMTSWLASLAYERMYAKSDVLLELLEAYTGDWQQAVYVLLARGLGFSVNAEPMQRLARAVPLAFLRRHSDSLISIESLLLGQAGLLPEADRADDYGRALRREYEFYRHKFSLKPLEGAGWKLKVRPPNMPVRRVAALASMIEGGFSLVGEILDAKSPDEVIELFRRPLSGYWAHRYTFGGVESERVPASLSRASATVLTINVAVPLLVAYGTRHGDEAMVERGMEWLTLLPAESNSVVSLFAEAGVSVRDAFSSQAVLQLRRRYCETRSCLLCRVGHRLLARKARR